MHVTASTLSVLAGLVSFVPKGISAQDCKSFQGANAASEALTWCDTLTDKCCTDDDGNVSPDACGNWSPYAEYNLCEGSCRGTNSCFNMLANAAPGSSISIKKGACVSNILNSAGQISGVCEHFAEFVAGVVNASIGKGACSGGQYATKVCEGFLRFGSGDVNVDIQDGACYGLAACNRAFANVASGSSILIKKGGCVGEETCEEFALEADGVVTASIGKGACSGGEMVCSEFLYNAEKVVMIDIQDGACSGGKEACYEVGSEADDLQALTVPAGECSFENACNSCGKENTSNEGLAITTACCNSAGNVDDACLYSDAPSIIPSISAQPSMFPSMSSRPSSVPSSDDGKNKKAKKGGKATKKKKTKKGEKASKGKKTKKEGKGTKEKKTEKGEKATKA